MTIRQFLFILAASVFIQSSGRCQRIEKILFDSTKNKDDCYVAIRPEAVNIQGTIVLLTSFLPPEALLTETKLQNTAYANNILTVMVPMNQKLYADSFAVNRINKILADIISRFSADTSKFALAGYDEAGSIALRYTELAYENPAKYPVQPKAVFGIDTPVDLFGLWHWSENQIKKNYWQGSVGDAKYYLDVMTKENNTIYNNIDRYKQLTPFYRESDTAGNERFLSTVAVRLYYDIDVNWQLQNRRNSFYDTKIPDGSELIKRLLLAGNDKAELVVAKQPGMKSNGVRNPNSMSIVEEAACIQWIKQSLDIFDVNTWKPPYELSIPAGWGVERFSLPPEFAPQISYKGVEDIRFTPGWGDVKSEEHWSYCFVWWLEGKPTPDAGSIQTALKEYYTGLVQRNILSRNIPAAKQVPTVATIKKIKTAVNDTETFSGTISMLDYHTGEPIILNCLVHVKSSKDIKHTTMYTEVSPKPFSHPVWQQLHSIGDSFRPKN